MNQDQAAENPDARGPHFKLDIKVVYPDGEVDSFYQQGGQVGIAKELDRMTARVSQWKAPVVPVYARCPVCGAERQLHTALNAYATGYVNQGCFGCGDEPWFEALEDKGFRAVTALAIVEQPTSFRTRLRSDWRVLRHHWDCGSGHGACDPVDPNELWDTKGCFDLYEVARRNGVDLTPWGIT